MPSKRRMYHLLRLVTKAALWGAFSRLASCPMGLNPELEGEPDGIEATPNIVSRTVGGLYRVNWINPFTGREALEEPSHAGGRGVSALFGPFCFGE